MNDTFLPGQRWVSHADSSLGLGIVTQADERRVTLHFPAVEEERVYATDRAPLTRLLLKAGDRLIRLDGHEYTVNFVSEHAGVVTYEAEDASGAPHKITETELDAHIELNTPIERLLNNQLSKAGDFDLRRTTLAHTASAEGFGLGGLLGPRTALLSHQLFVAASVGMRSAPRVLLADEVGLGKTIEAGLILSQQLLRQRVERVLILTPETLTHQWLVEMQRRFHFTFSLLNKARLEETDPVEEYADNALIISPTQLFADDPDLAEVVTQLPWDMVIIDEAHHLSGLSEPRSPLGAFAHKLASTTRGLLLLTATPEQAGLKNHFERLQLIDPDRFPDFEQFRTEQEQFTLWNAIIEQIEDGLSPDLPDGIDASADTDTQIQQMLDRYGTGRVLYRNSRRSIAGFPKRHLHEYPLTLPTLYGMQKNILHPELGQPEALWIKEDPRVSWLEDTLKQLRPEKALVICAHKETALAIEHHLHLKAGIRCAAFHEALSLIERDRAAAYFAEEISGAQALICSEIGSEGRNFQFAKHLICFDLPAHPDLLEQRIGRLDRIGQGTDIHIHVPYLEDSAQTALFKWLHEGLDAFSTTCSMGHQIFTEFETVLDAAMRGEQSLAPLLSETRSRRTQLTLETERGRDRLLDRHSHDTSRGAQIIASLEERESSATLYDFTEYLFDRMGIEQEYLDENLSLIRPTENLITGQLPGLDEDGVTATYDRETALSRDDVMFLTWEHPVVVESMAALLGSDIGKASFGTFSHRGVPAGTVLLEALYRIECLAPRHLEIGQFLNQTPLRMLLTKEGKDVGDKLTAAFLSSALNSVPGATSAAALSKLRPILEPLFSTMEQLSVRETEGRWQKALASAEAFFESEGSRLSYLKSINPTISDSDIAEAQRQRDACIHALQQSKPVLEGLRVCVAV
ncbi:MAG: RNA polymerase-associated protein RapA [Luminiphilus sp.]|jgi:ATP-dependent helicase HepA|nr:RNA polymerase-associated protein RapA [Luminiphilus sp.]